MTGFTHLHLHTHYSILDGACKVKELLEKAKKYQMKALAISDHGNMYGTMDFYTEAKKSNIKPIIGCEVYVASVSRFDKSNKHDRGAHLILLAKNENGYRNLSKMVTRAFKEGFYYNPRIDFDLLEKHHEGLICSTACLGGEIPSSILKNNIERAENLIVIYKKLFGEDFYLELMRHGLPDQDSVNPVLIELGKKYDVKVIATNDVHFINKEDFDAHHILICLNTGKDIDDPDGLHYTGQEYFKSPEEMQELFADIPEAIENTMEIAEKVEEYELVRKVVLPHYPMPEKYKSEDDYLRDLCYEGAKKKYTELNESVTERLDHELNIIKNMGFAGYFLIVQDFINKAKSMKVIVGPGRGSAAGSAVAYCIGITNVDPIKYNLLFERFLNPERISMPDIDVDFDDYGRDSVIKYVWEKYGKDKVAQIVTFGTMGAKSAIRDVARVLRLPLSETNRIAKMIPETVGITLTEAFSEVPELNDLKNNGSELVQKVLRFALTLEGIKRHTGTHACGVIIAPDILMEHIPLSTAKDSELMVSQYEGKLIEQAGMLKMDFLGLKTLTIMKDTLVNIEKTFKIEIDIDNIAWDDEKTFKLYHEGRTFGTFQFESEGMRAHLKKLKPNHIEDLIAMNALYRPGPMKYIPEFIDRKHGKKSVEYQHLLLEDILKPTYGIMVYQEQIMQAAQIIGGFSLGKADNLRRAMGKKKPEEMQKMKGEFIEGAKNKNIDEKTAEKIFDNMGRFAEYGFNRSHSAAYSIIAYQTAYLKANYPEQYMAAVLGHNMHDISKVNLLISECNKMGIRVLGPDINESDYLFTVSREKLIRFGLGAIKGVGEAAVEALIMERKKNGNFEDIFDICSRVNLRTVNKRTLESLALCGALDSFPDIHRAQYIYKKEGSLENMIDHAIAYGHKARGSKHSSETSLFADIMDVIRIAKPVFPECEPWTITELLEKEREYLGFYISGHPLDKFKLEIHNYCNFTIEDFKNEFHKLKGKKFSLGGMVKGFKEKISSNGHRYGIVVLEDYTDSSAFYVWRENYLKYKHLLETGTIIQINGTIKEGFNKKKEDLRADVTEILLMETLREKMIKSLNIRLNLCDIDENLGSSLNDIFESFPGKVPVKITITDKKEKLNLQLFSENYKIDPSDDLIEKLSELDAIQYKFT
jgi:DNA polymerase III subunit alpha